jgi:hypothetical protein
VLGTKTNDETGTVVIAEFGTENTTLVGIVHGTFVNSITANPDEIVITDYDGKDEITDCGTTTGFLHVDGTVTDDGTVT